MSKALKKVLTDVSNDPNYYPPPLDVEATKIIREIRSRFTQLALSYESSVDLANALDSILSPDYRRGMVAGYYYLTRELGLEKGKAIELLVEALEVVFGIRDLRHLLPVHKVIVSYLIKIISGEDVYSLYPLSLIDYVSELNLIYWDGEKWNLTELGKFMLKLPSPELVKALLTLETILPTSSNCMSRAFLKEIRKLLSRNSMHMHRVTLVENIIAEQLNIPQAMIHSWLTRLAELGLVTLMPGDGRLRANKLTPELLDSILNIRTNPYYALLSSLLLKSGPPLITTDLPAHIERLKDNPLLQSSWGEVKQALNSYNNRDYHAALRTLLPFIEKILREIAVREGIAGTDKGLNALMEIVKGHKLISARTEGLIKALGRDLELHGLEQLDTDRARFYAELAQMTLLELIRDYERHKLLHEAIKEISRELGMNPEELIKAYPNNRKTIHVQFLSDRKIRITIKSRHVYEVTKTKQGKLTKLRKSQENQQ